MARRAPKNPINDIKDAVGAWLGGNRGSVPSSGAGAAWQASARSAAQSGNQRIVKGLEEGVVQFGALGMGTSAQAQRDLMYGVPGAGTQAAKEASVSYVTGAAVGYGVGKVAGKVARKVANKLLPAEIGVHHSVAMTGKPFTGTVRGSKAGRSLTAMDQQAGQSYFWSTKGKGGAAKAANEVKFQTEEIGFKYVDFPDESTAMGYVTRIPRGLLRPDPNLLGSFARQVPGGTQKIVKSVAGTGEPYYAVARSFTDADAARLANAVRLAKTAEVAKSGAKIGGVAAGAAAGVGKVAGGKKKRSARGGGKNKK